MCAYGRESEAVARAARERSEQERESPPHDAKRPHPSAGPERFKPDFTPCDPSEPLGL